MWCNELSQVGIDGQHVGRRSKISEANPGFSGVQTSETDNKSIRLNGDTLSYAVLPDFPSNMTSTGFFFWVHMLQLGWRAGERYGTADLASK